MDRIAQELRSKELRKAKVDCSKCPLGIFCEIFVEKCYLEFTDAVITCPLITAIENSLPELLATESIGNIFEAIHRHFLEEEVDEASMCEMSGGDESRKKRDRSSRTYRKSR